MYSVFHYRWNKTFEYVGLRHAFPYRLTFQHVNARGAYVILERKDGSVPAFALSIPNPAYFL